MFHFKGGFNLKTFHFFS